MCVCFFKHIIKVIFHTAIMKKNQCFDVDALSRFYISLLFCFVFFFSPLLSVHLRSSPFSLSLSHSVRSHGGREASLWYVRRCPGNHFDAFDDGAHAQAQSATRAAV